MLLGRHKFASGISSAQQAPFRVREPHVRCLSRHRYDRLIHPGGNGAHSRIYVKGPFMRNALNLNPDHNAAISAEIGERLRVLLSKEQPGPSPRIQHLLDRLSALDATGGRSR